LEEETEKEEMVGLGGRMKKRKAQGPFPRSSSWAFFSASILFSSSSWAFFKASSLAFLSSSFSFSALLSSVLLPVTRLHIFHLSEIKASVEEGLEFPIWHGLEGRRGKWRKWDLKKEKRKRKMTYNIALVGGVSHLPRWG